MRARARDGFILVAVLGIMALLASLTGGTTLLVRAAFDGVRGNADALRLEALVRAGVELSAYELFELGLPAARITEQQVRLDDGTVTLTASDEAGRIDLNWSDPALIAGAYRVAGLTSLQPKVFAARVVAWRDRDAQKDPPGGGQAADAPKDTPRKEGFRTVADLRWLPGVTARDAEALAPLLTVHNPEGRVNVMSAPNPVLMALPEMTPSVAAQVVALRGSRAPDTPDRIRQLLQKQEAFVGLVPGRSFRVRIVARSGARAARTATVTLVRAPKAEAPYYVAAWSR